MLTPQQASTWLPRLRPGSAGIYSLAAFNAGVSSIPSLTITEYPWTTHICLRGNGVVSYEGNLVADVDTPSSCAAPLHAMWRHVYYDMSLAPMVDANNATPFPPMSCFITLLCCNSQCI